MQREHLLACLESSPPLLRLLVERADDNVRRTRPTADQWSVNEHLFHLRDTTQLVLGRFERMMCEDEPLLPDWDQDAAVAAGNYNEADPAAALAEFDALRGRLITVLQTADLERTGRHELMGLFTIGGWADYTVVHDMQHMAEIARILQSAPLRR